MIRPRYSTCCTAAGNGGSSSVDVGPEPSRRHLLPHAVADAHDQAGFKGCQAALKGSGDERQQSLGGGRLHRGDRELRTTTVPSPLSSLGERGEGTVSAQLRQLYPRRGDTYVSLPEWQQVVDDNAHVFTRQTTDVELL